MIYVIWVLLKKESLRPIFQKFELRLRIAFALSVLICFFVE